MKPPIPEMLIAVDEDDRQLGLVEKMEAHRARILHRAVSGFVFSRDGKLLVQRRAAVKYHCGGMLANSCCSHPKPGESGEDCIARRTIEEVGLAARFQDFDRFRYDVPVGNDLYENELVHMFFAITDDLPAPNAEEVSETLWLDEQAISGLMASGEPIAPWFALYWTEGKVARAFALARDAIGRTERP